MKAVTMIFASGVAAAALVSAAPAAAQYYPGYGYGYGGGGNVVGQVLNQVLGGGYKANVIPGEATAQVDGRFLPGTEDDYFATIDRLLGPKVSREFIHHLPAVETSFDGGLVNAMSEALLAEDPGAKAVPYCLSGGTDAKSFSRLGVRNYGFSPLRLPPELDFAGMFHGVDERVPVDGLRFGVRVLDRFIDMS